MTHRDRIRALLAVVALLVVVKLGQQVWRWYAYSGERAQLVEMREELLDAGVGVVRVQARADTLRREIDEYDQRLQEQRRRVDRYERYARGGELQPSLYRTYREDLERYNRSVRERNERVEEWNRLLLQEQAALDRYHDVAERMRKVAGKMGDRYYSIPLPVEAAAERSVIGAPGG